MCLAQHPTDLCELRIISCYLNLNWNKPNWISRNELNRCQCTWADYTTIYILSTILYTIGRTLWTQPKSMHYMYSILHNVFIIISIAIIQLQLGLLLIVQLISSDRNTWNNHCLSLPLNLSLSITPSFAFVRKYNHNYNLLFRFVRDSQRYHSF